MNSPTELLHTYVDCAAALKNKQGITAHINMPQLHTLACATNLAGHLANQIQSHIIMRHMPKIYMRRVSVTSTEKHVTP